MQFKRGDKAPSGPLASDVALAEGFSSGEPWAFAEVDAAYRKPIFSFVLKRVKNREISEELTQEVLLKCYRFRDSYDPAQSLPAWLWTIARNALTDWFRRERPGEAWAESREPLAEAEIPCSRPTVEAAVVLRDQRRKRLKSIFKGLTRLQRRVLWLRLFRHLSYAEISRRLGLSISAVKCVVHRATRAITSLTAVRPWPGSEPPRLGRDARDLPEPRAPSPEQSGS